MCGTVGKRWRTFHEGERLAAAWAVRSDGKKQSDDSTRRAKRFRWSKKGPDCRLLLFLLFFSWRVSHRNSKERVQSTWLRKRGIYQTSRKNTKSLWNKKILLKYRQGIHTPCTFLKRNPQVNYWSVPTKLRKRWGRVFLWKIIYSRIDAGSLAHFGLSRQRNRRSPVHSESERMSDLLSYKGRKGDNREKRDNKKSSNHLSYRKLSYSRRTLECTRGVFLLFWFSFSFLILRKTQSH